LPMPTQPATLTATRVATKAMSTFFIGVPLSSRHAMHTSCLAAPLVVRCPQWFTASVDSGALRRGLCPWRHSLGARYSFAACFSTGSSARPDRPFFAVQYQGAATVYRDRSSSGLIVPCQSWLRQRPQCIIGMAAPGY
jgi:hypothetical protein